MSGTIVVVILIVCVAAVAAGIIYRNRAKRRNNVVQMARFKKQPDKDKRKQKCSYCKKMSDRLTFYAGAHGSAVGVCKHCKPKAEKQDLMPI